MNTDAILPTSWEIIWKCILSQLTLSKPGEMPPARTFADVLVYVQPKEQKLLP